MLNSTSLRWRLWHQYVSGYERVPFARVWTWRMHTHIVECMSCPRNTSDLPGWVLIHTQLVMMCLGWSFNFKKSVFVPSQTIVHLSFVFDTVSMTIFCSKDKIMRLVVMCRSALKDRFITVHAWEKLLGTMESVRPCTPLAALHYRSLQKQLISAKR